MNPRAERLTHAHAKLLGKLDTLEGEALERAKARLADIGASLDALKNASNRREEVPEGKPGVTINT